eukprot:1158672-Pelagomonas_calceolata.AAC.13
MPATTRPSLPPESKSVRQLIAQYMKPLVQHPIQMCLGHVNESLAVSTSREHVSGAADSSVHEASCSASNPDVLGPYGQPTGHGSPPPGHGAGVQNVHIACAGFGFPVAVPIPGVVSLMISME